MACFGGWAQNSLAAAAPPLPRRGAAHTLHSLLGGSLRVSHCSNSKPTHVGSSALLLRTSTVLWFLKLARVDSYGEARHAKPLVGASFESLRVARQPSGKGSFLYWTCMLLGKSVESSTRFALKQSDNVVVNHIAKQTLVLLRKLFFLECLYQKCLWNQTRPKVVSAFLIQDIPKAGQP